LHDGVWSYIKLEAFVCLKRKGKEIADLLINAALIGRRQNASELGKGVGSGVPSGGIGLCARSENRWGVWE